MSEDLQSAINDLRAQTLRKARAKKKTETVRSELVTREELEAIGYKPSTIEMILKVFS